MKNNLLKSYILANQLKEANLNHAYSIFVSKLLSACKKAKQNDFSELNNVISEYNQSKTTKSMQDLNAYFSNLVKKSNGNKMTLENGMAVLSDLNARANPTSSNQSGTPVSTNQEQNPMSTFQMGSETNFSGGNPNTGGKEVDPSTNPGDFLKQNGITQQSIDILKASGRTEEEIAALSARLYTNISDSMGLKDSGNPSTQENNSKVLNNFINHLKTKGFLPSSYAFK